MLPDKLNTKRLQTYHYLDKELTWGYIRYVEIEKFKTSPAYIFIFHINGCDNKQEADIPTAVANRKGEIFCTGCGVEVPKDIFNAASALWMIEKTKYGS